MIEERLRQTSRQHEDHLTDSFVYMIAEQEMEVREGYIHLHIRERPSWLPDFIYKWVLSKVLVLTTFRKPL